MQQHEAIIRVLEEEKEYYKKEYEALKSLRRSATPSRATPTKVTTPLSLKTVQHQHCVLTNTLVPGGFIYFDEIC
jgi:hypothetical protein